MDGDLRYPHRAGYKGRSDGPGAQGAEYYASQLKGRRAQVYNGLGAGPATSEQIGARIGLHWYLVRPRLSELQALGLVKDTGETAPSALGGKSTIWRITTPEERAHFAAQQAVKAEKEQADG